MCLCPNCHDMATKGALPEHEQRRLKEQPLNIECGLTAGKLAVTESPLALELGSVLVVNDGPIVALDDVVVIAVTYDGASPLLSLDLRGPTGETVLLIDENEWVLGHPNVWDATCDHQKLKLWSAPYKVELQLDLSRVPGRVRGAFWTGSGKRIVVTNHGIEFPDTEGRISELALVRLPVSLTDASITIGGPGGGMMVSEPDRLERYRKAINAYRGSRLTGFE